jgi:hypothetical protein
VFSPNAVLDPAAGFANSFFASAGIIEMPEATHTVRRRLKYLFITFIRKLSVYKTAFSSDIIVSDHFFESAWLN